MVNDFDVKSAKYSADCDYPFLSDISFIYWWRAPVFIKATNLSRFIYKCFELIINTKNKKKRKKKNVYSSDYLTICCEYTFIWFFIISLLICLKCKQFYFKQIKCSWFQSNVLLFLRLSSQLTLEIKHCTVRTDIFLFI